MHIIIKLSVGGRSHTEYVLNSVSVPEEKWINGKLYDLIFIFSFLWVAPLLLLFVNNGVRENLKIFLPFTILLSQGHKYSPMILMFFSPYVRSHIKKQRPHIFREIFLLLFTPACLAAAAAFLYLSNAAINFFIPISVLAAAYTLWQYFHFSQQNYGVLKLYRNLNLQRSDPFLDRYDQISITLVALFVTFLICTFSNLRTGFYLYFFQPLSMPDELRSACLVFCAGLYLFSLGLYSHKKSLNLPVFLAISHYYVLSFFICAAPLYLALLLSSVSHWTQAIYLAATQLKRDPGIKLNVYGHPGVAGFVLAFLVFSTLFYALYDFIDKTLPTISNFGEIKDFSAYEPLLAGLAILYFGINIGVNYCHFYLDRFVYKKNSLLKSFTGSVSS